MELVDTALVQLELVHQSHENILKGFRMAYCRDYRSSKHITAIASKVARAARQDSAPAVVGIIQVRDGVTSCLQEPGAILDAMEEYWGGFWYNADKCDPVQIQSRLALPVQESVPFGRISGDQIVDFVRHVDARKKGGADGLRFSELRLLSEDLLRTLARFYDKVWQHGAWPLSFVQQWCSYPRLARGPRQMGCDQSSCCLWLIASGHMLRPRT
eukprot:6481665-Amphidinium_carterae.5